MVKEKDMQVSGCATEGIHSTGSCCADGNMCGNQMLDVDGEVVLEVFAVSDRVFGDHHIL
jgi:hypothetical protein